jgi:death-on-curing protein
VTDYVSLAEALAIHEDLIARYGGTIGLRDITLLESALFRPQASYYKDLIEEAAALWESLSQNHPFIDGNKRTAFAVTYTFLLINGQRIVANPNEAFAFISELYDTGDFAFGALKAWLELHVELTG